MGRGYSERVRAAHIVGKLRANVGDKRVGALTFAQIADYTARKWLQSGEFLNLSEFPQHMERWERRWATTIDQWTPPRIRTPRLQALAARAAPARQARMRREDEPRAARLLLLAPPRWARMLHPRQYVTRRFPLPPLPRKYQHVALPHVRAAVVCEVAGASRGCCDWQSVPA